MIQFYTQLFKLYHSAKIKKHAQKKFIPKHTQKNKK